RRRAVGAPARFERVVEVVPSYPGDVVAALQIHVREAEKRAGRALFEDIDWERGVRQSREPSVGDWVPIRRGRLRRKARCEAALEPATPVRTDDLLAEVERFQRASD